MKFGRTVNQILIVAGFVFLTFGFYLYMSPTVMAFPRELMLIIAFFGLATMFLGLFRSARA